MIKGVLLDLDHTLCSTEHGVEVALKYFANLCNIQNSIHLKEQFNKINNYLFNQYLEGQFSIDEFRIKRFEQLLTIFGAEKKCDISVEQEAGVFTNIMNKNCILYEDTIEFLEYLQIKNIKVGLLTNGPADGQRTKLESLSILHYFDEIFISGETGYEKPNIIAFTNALDVMQINFNNSVMIGDSIEFDINPALSLGMKVILIDRLGKQPNIQSPAMTVQSFKTLQNKDYF